MKLIFLVCAILFCFAAQSSQETESGLQVAYGKVNRLQRVVVDDSYKADAILEGVRGNAAEYEFRLRGTNKLITVASKVASGVMITDCVRILYNDDGIQHLEKVHGDHCVKIH